MTGSVFQNHVCRGTSLTELFNHRLRRTPSCTGAPGQTQRPPVWEHSHSHPEWQLQERAYSADSTPYDRVLAIDQH